MNNSEFALVIITGLSGAGKSSVANILEDAGYFIVDNIPPALISQLIDLVRQAHPKIKDVAIVVDIRGRGFFNTMVAALDDLKKSNIQYNIIYLEASDEVLIQRFKETRRKHPLFRKGGILEDITEERSVLEEMRSRADWVIDTTKISLQTLRTEINEILVKRRNLETMSISIVSFGYKRGLPLDSDIILDVRFLPNPYYVPTLKELDGKNEKIRDYVLNNKTAKKFMKLLYGMVEFLLPQYIKEGKSHLSIAIGCTGGRHRSVVISDELSSFLKEKGFCVITRYRDLDPRLD